MEVDQLDMFFRPELRLQHCSVVVLTVLCFGVDFCAVWALCALSYFSSVQVTEWPSIGE